MDFADSGDLLQKIKAGVKFSEEEVWTAIIQMVRGLKALHDQNILHWDLKSANVFLYNDGTVKLGDMNVSKIMQQKMSLT